MMDTKDIKFVFDVFAAHEAEFEERLANGEVPVATDLEVDYKITPHDDHSEAVITCHFEGEDEEHYVNLDGWLLDFIVLGNRRIDDLNIDWKNGEVTLKH